MDVVQEKKLPVFWRASQDFVAVTYLAMFVVKASATTSPQCHLPSHDHKAHDDGLGGCGHVLRFKLRHYNILQPWKAELHTIDMKRVESVTENMVSREN